MVELSIISFTFRSCPESALTGTRKGWGAYGGSGWPGGGWGFCIEEKTKKMSEAPRLIGREWQALPEGEEPFNEYVRKRIGLPEGSVVEIRHMQADLDGESLGPEDWPDDWVVDRYAVKLPEGYR